MLNKVRSKFGQPIAQVPSAKALLSDERWKQGPQFLWLEESSWPRFPASLDTSSQDDLEIKEHKRVYSVQLKNLAQPDDKVFAY